MAAADLLPRFFKAYVSHLSSDSMLIPYSYYDELPNRLPKTAILQGPRGGSWEVSFMQKQDEVHFGNGWVKFVEDNRLCDGDFLMFVYNGVRIFEVSIFRHDGCKDVLEEDDGELIGSEETDTETESEMANPILRIKNKGKEKVEEDSHGDSDSDEDSHGDSESDEDYVAAFGQLDVSEDSSNSGNSYSPDMEYEIACVKPKATNSKKKGSSSRKPKVGKRRIAKPKIKNPERYLDNPKNVHLETCVKNRTYELLVHSQLVRDYELKFKPFVHYIDRFGELEAKTMKWGDGRVVVKRWIRICERNKLKKDDGILCEFFRKQGVVYALKVHIVRAKDL